MDIATPGPIGTPFPDPPDIGQAREVAEGVLWLRLPLPMALDHVNVFALDDGDGWTLVDTGIASRKAMAIWEGLLTGPLKGRPVRRVVVTHHHPDHIGLAGWFQDRGAELWTTRTAWLFARMLVLDVQETPLPQVLEHWRGAGMPPDMLARKAGERPFNFADVVAPMPLGYRRIAEGDAVRMGGRNWRVRVGHGHAPEQATFWSEHDNLILGGDQLLASISPNIGVYATEPDADPLSEWIASARAFRPHAREDHLVLPGHKLPFTGLPRRLEEMVANHDEALARLVGHLARPSTAVDCFSTLYRRNPGEAEFGLALVEAVAHLNHLLKAGRVRRWRREDGAWLWQREG